MGSLTRKAETSWQYDVTSLEQIAHALQHLYLFVLHVEIMETVPPGIRYVTYSFELL